MLRRQALLCARAREGARHWGVSHMLQIEHEWQLAGINLAVFAMICALTFAIGGIDAAVLAA